MSESRMIKHTLEHPKIHHKWAIAYRTAENDDFFNQAFDRIIEIIDAPKNSTFIDFGCGSCSKSICLANRGFSVIATDFSKSALEMAQLNIKSSGFQNRIALQREDILSLSFKNDTFNYALCWGVLMHIPNLDKAISEISRVIKPGGFLVISESNVFSLQAIFMRSLKRLLGKQRASVKKRPGGIEFWETTSEGTLMTRQADINWLVRRLKKMGFIAIKFLPGQFTELYVNFSSRHLKKIIHSFNNSWFKYIKTHYFAFGNIVIFQKQL